MQSIFSWLGAALVALLLAAAHQLDGADHSHEFAQADEVEAAARAQEADARRLAAGRQLCEQVGGPNVADVWLVDGSLACRSKRGRLLTIHPREAL